MKKKFIIFTLCFTLIFSSLNYKKSYADMGVISAPMVGVISTVAVASGIILNNSDEIVEFANMFYQTNKENWQEINSLFKATVSIGADKVVTVGKSFLDKIYNFLDILKVSTNGSLGSIDKLGQMTIGVPYKFFDLVKFNSEPYVFEDIHIYVPSLNSTYPLAIWVDSFSSYYINFGYVYNGEKYLIANYNSGNFSNTKEVTISLLPSQTDIIKDGLTYLNLSINLGSLGLRTHHHWFSSDSMTNVFTVQGNYDKALVNDNLKEDGSVDVFVPGNLDSLVGVGSSDVLYNPSVNPPYELPVGGVVNIPDVSNPSIDVNVDASFPSVDSPSVPSEGIWSNIKDFIISLVVPSDAFWTDTWGGLYNNFTDSFPMVDMDGFNDLVTGEKKFPNIDINIMGVTGRVVNGDVINSIVDWLRPIIAGFMMLCLMLFNYRKIYKLVRNSEPFGSIASGTSDFSTGISEYSKQDVVKATDMVAEYRAWKERGGK